MNKRRLASGTILIVISISALLSAFVLFQPEPTDEEETITSEIIPHPYNSLNWWDLAWEFGNVSTLLPPLLEITARGNRHNVQSEANYISSGDYLIERLENWGIDAWYTEPNLAVLGYQRGYANDGRAIVFGAHLDTDETGIGVDDNAGGVAVVTMIAEILSQFRLPVDIYYCYFSHNWAVERDPGGIVDRHMWGAHDVVDYFQAQQSEILAFYNFDEIMFYDNLQDETQSYIAQHSPVFALGYHKTQYLADLLSTFLKQSGNNILTPTEDLLTLREHQVFWGAGLPAVNIMSGHTPDPENPPQDRVFSDDYNLEHAAILAESAAALGIYLALSGNGAATKYKLEKQLIPGQVEKIELTMSVNQKLVFAGETNANQSLSVSIVKGGVTILPSTIIQENNFTLETDMDLGFGPMTVDVTNTGNKSAFVNMHLIYEMDQDGDGVVDSVEYTWDEPIPALDWDNDGLSDIDERIVGTDIFIADTDMDNMNDGFEVLYNLDPLQDDSVADLDHDGLTNIREMNIGTYPNTNDTDNDMMDDYWEVLFRTNPLVDDAMLDLDNDNLTNIEEYIHGADPRSVDGDYDGVSDSEEIMRGMDALSDDTDQDGLRDRLELLEGLDPLTPDYDVDLSPDGPDHNPKINALLVLALLVFGPVSLGTLLFRRRLR